MSRAGDYNRLEAIGTVELVDIARGYLTAFLLRIDDGAGEPCRIVVWPPPGVGLELQKGDRVWLRGRLAYEDVQGRRALHYIQATHLEPASRLVRTG
jgi:hypothetical protein